MHLSARRAREINDYYHSLGEGLGQYTPPLVEQVDSNKPLSIALEEIATGKIVIQYPGEARRAVEDLLAAELAAAGEGDSDVGEDAALQADQEEAPEGGRVAVLPTDAAAGVDEES